MELSLVDHVRRGKLLDLSADNEAVDEAEMRSWGDSRTCRAAVIRDILLGRLAADPDPHGLRLRGARISGRLDLENLTTDVSFELTDCLLEEGVLARDARMTFVGLARCRLEHPAEPPMDADRLACNVMDLSGATIKGQDKRGAVRLLTARISSYLICSGATLGNDSGPALLADGLQVLHMFLRDGFTATGSGEKGAVNLAGAHISSNLECDGAILGNDSGPALIADGLQVGQNMYLRHRFTATGSGEKGAVFLAGAHIGGQLDCTGARLGNNSGPALIAERLQVGENMYLQDGFSATGGGVDAAVSLTGTRIGGTLLFDVGGIKHATNPDCLLTMDGLTYAGVPEPVSAGDWVRLLRHGTPSYAAQPYQQLAAGYQALGDDLQARQILMAQRDDQLTRTKPRPRWSERLWGRITKVTLGYGYQPWRALLFLILVIALACVLAVVLGSHGALAQTDQTATPGQPCTVIQQVSVGLDLNLPVGTTVARADCDLTKDSSSVAAAWLTAGGWALRLLAWAFAALFIAGFTSAVRKT